MGNPTGRQFSVTVHTPRLSLGAGFRRVAIRLANVFLEAELGVWSCSVRERTSAPTRSFADNGSFLAFGAHHVFVARDHRHPRRAASGVGGGHHAVVVLFAPCGKTLCGAGTTGRGRGCRRRAGENKRRFACPAPSPVWASLPSASRSADKILLADPAGAVSRRLYRRAGSASVDGSGNGGPVCGGATGRAHFSPTLPDAGHRARAGPAAGAVQAARSAAVACPGAGCSGHGRGDIDLAGFGYAHHRAGEGEASEGESDVLARTQ